MDQQKRVESVVVVMRANFQNFKFASRWFLAASLMVAPFLAATSWAENYTLDSVDFASNGERINVIFHTGSIVPVQKVLVSNNKLILDIDQVTADDTVKTNFIQASNISHVIMQPLGDHKVRMIIRGENLGPPSVAFFNPTVGAYSLPNPSYNGPKLQENTATTLNEIQEQGTQTAALNSKQDQGMEQTAVDTQPMPDTLQASELPAETEMPILDSIQPAPTSKTPTSELLSPLTLPNNNAANAGTKNPFFDFKLPHSWETYIPYGLLGLLILGIAGFVGYRILKLKQADAPMEDWIAEEETPSANAKRSSFREMAAAYRNNKRQQDKHAKKPHADEPIGLRGLKQHMNDPVESVAPAPKPVAPQPVAKPISNNTSNNNKTLDNILAALQESQARKAAPASVPNNVAPKKQAVNQYLKNNSAPAQKNAKAKELNYQETLQRELKRAQDIQNQVQQQLKPNPLQQKRNIQPGAKPVAAPVNRAPAAKKAAPVSRPAAPNSKQGPLPDNPEVLNFLRNVADLMEKDGKNDIAKSIHKNLNTQKLIP